ncbi:MAG: putative MPP superfamily phosphohydrolase [Crocinitomicaceae bacterium]|jgi:predicted MPP superfamily phosphohydrolase
MNILRIIIMIIGTTVIFGLPLWNLVRLRNKKHILWAIVPIVIFLTIFASANIFEAAESDFWYKIFKSASYYWLIVSMMLFSMSLLWTLAMFAFKIPAKKIFWLIIASTLLYVAVAAVNGQRLVVKDLELPGQNITRQYDFVHITDLHSGSTDRAYAQRVVEKIKQLDPEFMVITGDFIDEYYARSYDIEPFNELDFPIFLITGNHEYYLEDGKIEEVIADTDILLIDDMKIAFDELDIIGVNELATVDQTISAIGGINVERYTILLDHQPKTSEAIRAEANGARLMLSGHTHKGQIWPMNWLIKLQFKYVSGLYEIGNMFLYVNQGTGTLGPKWRVNSVNEITHIHLKPIL